VIEVTVRPRVARRPGVLVVGRRPSPPAVNQRRALAPLRVVTLGGFQVWRGAALLPQTAWSEHKARSLFACLLSAPNYQLSQDQVLELLWPGVPPEAGASRLRYTLHQLRAILDGQTHSATKPGTGYIERRGDLLCLLPAGGQPARDDWLDAERFAHLADTALTGQDPAACRAALALYGGDYLPGEPYADWAAGRREELRWRYQALLLHQARLTHRVALGEAEPCLRLLLAADQGHEEAALLLMRGLAVTGRRAEALRVYQALAAALYDDLGVAPGDEAQALRYELSRAPLVPTAPRRPIHLPHALTSFIGRGQERIAIAALLETHRLVTLTGIGGAGKTRLALHVAEDVRPSFPDGVWLLEAAPLTSEVQLYRTIAAVLDLREDEDRPLATTLLDFLVEKRLLLVLDNCEHLIDACATVTAAILRACPSVHVMTTSREALGIAGERSFLVPPLSLPEPTELPTLAALSRSEAVQLLLDRMPPTSQGAGLTERSAAAVAEICRRLDGLPLAIELAAAQLGALSPEALAARLDDRFHLLTAGNRGAPPRHHTLRAAMDWSYVRLTTSEQAVLRRAAVFQGIWRLDAMESVCGGADVSAVQVAPILASLVAKSLISTVDEVDGRAYMLLETVRHYGLERLRECDELAEAQERHRLFYVTLAEQATRERATPLLPAWLRRLDAARANLRAAIELPVAGPADHALRARLVIGLRFFWDIRGYLGEGRQYLAMVLAEQNELEPQIQAWILTVAGDLAYRQGDCLEARDRQLASLRLFQTLDDREGMAAASIGLGNVAQCEGNYQQAEELFEECLHLRRQLGDHRGIASALENLGEALLAQGDAERASALIGASLTIAQARGDLLREASVLNGLGLVALRGGEFGRAAELFRRSLTVDREIGDRWGSYFNLEDLAVAAIELGALEHGARLFGAVDRLRAAHGAPLDQSHLDLHREAMARLDATLPPSTRMAAWDWSRVLTLDAVVDYALSTEMDCCLWVDYQSYLL